MSTVVDAPFNTFYFIESWVILAKLVQIKMIAWQGTFRSSRSMSQCCWVLIHEFYRIKSSVCHLIQLQFVYDLLDVRGFSLMMPGPWYLSISSKKSSLNFRLNRSIKAGEAAARLIGAYGGVSFVSFMILQILGWWNVLSLSGFDLCHGRSHKYFILKPAKKRFNFPMGSREHDVLPSGTGRYKAMARRFYEFVKWLKLLNFDIAVGSLEWNGIQFRAFRAVAGMDFRANFSQFLIS